MYVCDPDRRSDEIRSMLAWSVSLLQLLSEMATVFGGSEEPAALAFRLLVLLGRLAALFLDTVPRN